MAQTTAAVSLVDLVMAWATDSLIAAYQYDEVTAIPFARFADISSQATHTHRFHRGVKDVHSDLADEGDALVPEEWQVTKVDVTVSRVGIAREVTETAFEDTTLGRAGVMAELVMDSAILLGMAKDEDLIAQWPNASNDVANSGNPLTILDLVAAFGKQRAAKARGAHFVHLHDIQLGHLQVDQASAQSTPWATFFQPNADHTAYGGVFMGAPVFASSLNPTSDAGANRVGVVAPQGQSSPRYGAFGYVSKRAPRTKTDEKILEDSTVMATITRYGTGVPAANFATKVRSSAT